MDVSKYAYIQAKIQGMFARSWLGDRLRQIIRLKQVSEYYSILFDEAPPQIPEHEMISFLQQKIIERNVGIFIDIISSIKNPPDILLHILRRYEFRSVKALLRKSGTDEPKLSFRNLLGDFGLLRDHSEAGLSEILSGTPYEWIIEARKNGKPLVLIENELDIRYYEQLWKDIERLAGNERKIMENLIMFEITLQNLVWALRLLIYFKKSREETETLLIPVPDKRKFPEILQIFSFAPDGVQEWKDWTFSWLIEEQYSEDFRGIDPAAAEFRSVRILYRKYRRLFHSYPFTVIPVYCFFRLKDFETDILQSVLEGVRISASEDEILDLLGGL